MSTEAVDTPCLRRYRLAARDWLSSNMVKHARMADGTYRRAADSDPSVVRVTEARQMQAKLFDAGYAGITFPKHFGGGGLGLDHERVFLEEADAFDMPTAVFAVSLNILGMTLLQFGTEEQNERHLPRMLRGDELWLQLLSEPSGGSDLAGLITRAQRDGDFYILNGQKIWSTGAQFADLAMCPARTDWDAPKHRGISMFIVDLHAPGIEVRAIKQINGGTDFCEEFLTDVAVPASNLLGGENDGWRVLRGLLSIEHEWVGRSGGNRPRPVGVDDLVTIVKRRQLLDDDGARRCVADVHGLQIVHARLTQRVSRGIEAGALDPSFGGLLKLGSDIVRQRRNEALLALSGTRGIAWRAGDEGNEIAADYLQSRSATIAGGSSEIQRNNLSERALGLPREPSPDRNLPFREVPKN